VLDQIFKSIFVSSTTQVISVSNFLLCIVASLVIGALLATVHTYKNRSTKNFVVTLALLPAVVCVVIMMVNGNVGTGVAVAGAFSLVRFRSVPGTAKEICAIFLAMAVGLATGMGYLAYGLLFAVILGGVNMLYYKTGFGEQQWDFREKTMRITIPEDLDYTDVFEDLLEAYTDGYTLVSVKTTNLGSMYKLTYHLTLKDIKQEKALIDKLRCRNGNLEISSSKQEMNSVEL